MQCYKATRSKHAEPIVQYFGCYLDVFNLWKAGVVMKTLNIAGKEAQELSPSEYQSIYTSVTAKLGH